MKMKGCSACTHNHPVCVQCEGFNDSMLEVIKHGSHHRDMEQGRVYNGLGDRIGIMRYWFCDSACLFAWVGDYERQRRMDI